MTDRIDLPQYTFVLRPSQGSDFEFTQNLILNAQDARTVEIDFLSSFYDVADALHLSSIDEVRFYNFLHDTYGGRFLGNLFIKDLESIWGPDISFVCHNCRNFSDIRPFVEKFGPERVLLIQLGPLRAHFSGVRSVWLPSSGTAARLNELCKELQSRTGAIP